AAGHEHVMAHLVGQDLHRVVLEPELPHRLQVHDHALVGEADHGEAAAQAFLRRLHLPLAEVRVVQPRELAPGGERLRPGGAPPLQQRHGRGRGGRFRHRRGNSRMACVNGDVTATVCASQTSARPSGGRSSAIASWAKRSVDPAMRGPPCAGAAAAAAYASEVEAWRTAPYTSACSRLKRPPLPTTKPWAPARTDGGSANV